MSSDDKQVPQATPLAVGGHEDSKDTLDPTDKVEGNVLSQPEHHVSIPLRDEPSIPKWRLVSLYIRYSSHPPERSLRLTVLISVFVWDFSLHF